MSTPLPVLLHLGFALVALVLIPVAQLARRLGISHRLAGRAAAGAMAAAAFTSLFLLDHGVTPLHLLAVIMLVSLLRAVLAIRRGHVARHRTAMLICAASLLVAGVAAVAVPGRLLHAALLG
jgi:uncharacterized membrane protein